MDSSSVPKEPTKITITLATTAYFMSGIRDFTLGLIKNSTQLGEKWAFRFQSIIDELCNNAIEYGSKKGSEIRIVFYHNPKDYIAISVEDTGTGESKLKAKDLEDLVEKRSAPDYVAEGLRGRGLGMIVKSWTDEIKFEDTKSGGIKVTVKKFLKQAQEEAEKIEAENPDPTKINL